MANLSKTSMTFRYVSALGLIAVLTLMSHVTLMRVISQHTSSASVINMSGRQRMLSQRIASLALQYFDGDQSVREDFNKAVTELEENHLHLMALDTANGSEMRQFYVGGADALDPIIKSYLQNAKVVLANEETSATRKNSLKAMLDSARRPLLDRLNLITKEHVRRNDLELERMQHLQTVILLFVLLTLVGEALGVFRPMVRQVVLATERLHQLSQKDPLTGLNNRRGFAQQVEIEFNRLKRSGQPASLISLDVDHFKKINDTFGHNAGDEVLKKLASELSASVRPSDIIARFGGEEFLFFLPETDLSGASKLAERIRKRIESLNVTYKTDVIKFTISLGACDVAIANASLSTDIDRADGALYEAKKNGRNQVVLAELGSSESPTGRLARAG